MKKVALLLSLFVVLAAPLSAQVSFFCSQDTIPASQSAYSAVVSVANYQEIVGTQFTFSWDSTVLEFTGISDINSNYSYNDHFGIDKVSSGILRFAWFDNALTGISLPDSTTLFKVDFEVSGTAGSSSTLLFTDTPVEREVIDTSFERVTSEFHDGLVFFNTTSNLRTQPSELNISRIQPNPLAGTDPIIKFYIKETDTLILRVVTMEGRERYYTSLKVNAGDHELKLDQSLFSEAGLYLVTLQSQKFISTHKLLVKK